MTPKTCEHCDKPFMPVRAQQRFCADACRSAHHRQNPNPLEREAQFSLTLANPNPSFKTRKDGDHYFVEFELQKDEWEYFVNPNVNRQGMVIEADCSVSHIAKPEKKPEMKGGPLAQIAGQWCNEEVFQAWSHTSDAETARAYILGECGISSRKELDHNKAAAEIFHKKIRIPFKDYLDGITYGYS